MWNKHIPQWLTNTTQQKLADDQNEVGERLNLQSKLFYSDIKKKGFWYQYSPLNHFVPL